MNLFRKVCPTASAVAIASALSFGLPAITHAEINQTMEPLQAVTFALDGYTAVVYYVQHNDGSLEIVTTTGPDIDVMGVTTQQHTTLAPGQSSTLSFDRGDDTHPLKTIEFTATLDTILVVQY